MAAIHAHRRAIDVFASYISPYPTANMVSYHDTNFGRNSAVIESGGKVTAFRQKAPATSFPSLTGSVTWQIDPIDRKAILVYAGSDALSMAIGSTLSQPYTFFMVIMGDFSAGTYQNGAGASIATGGGGLNCYTGGGGSNNQLKVYAGSSYVETGEMTFSGRGVIGVSLTGSGSCITCVNANTYDISASRGLSGTAAITSLGVGSVGVGVGLVLVYNRAYSAQEMSNMSALIRREFNIV